MLPLNPSLRDECKLYQLLCCAIHYMFTHSFCPATLNGVLGSCCKLRRLNFTGGNPLEPSLPMPLAMSRVNEIYTLVAVRISC